MTGPARHAPAGSRRHRWHGRLGASSPGAKAIIRVELAKMGRQRLRVAGRYVLADLELLQYQIGTVGCGGGTRCEVQRHRTGFEVVRLAVVGLGKHAREQGAGRQRIRVTACDQCGLQHLQAGIAPGRLRLIGGGAPAAVVPRCCLSCRSISHHVALSTFRYAAYKDFFSFQRLWDQGQSLGDAWICASTNRA